MTITYECPHCAKWKRLYENTIVKDEGMQLYDEIDALKKDAMRYRWDRDNFMREQPNEYKTTAEFDAMVDEAMRK